jgi:YHS domain-containing protein
MIAKLDQEEDLLKDPVCDMSVSRDSEYVYDYADKQYLFCSEHCLKKFKATPEQYLEKESSPPGKTDSELKTYTCPMHPEGSCRIIRALPQMRDGAGTGLTVQLVKKKMKNSST